MVCIYKRLCYTHHHRHLILHLIFSPADQGRSQKFVLGGIKFFGGIKLLNSHSDAILPHKKFTWADFWGDISRYPPTRCYAPAADIVDPTDDDDDDVAGSLGDNDVNDNAGRTILHCWEV